MTYPLSGNPASYFKRLLRSFGVDRAIAYTLVAQGWTVVSGPITLFFLMGHLSPAEQGFYYTFGSVLGLQVFLELGLGFVLLQFASHEKAELHWTAEGILEGNANAKARLASLLRSAALWYCIIAVLLVTVMLPTGLSFFARNSGGDTVVWRLPWIWLVVVTASTLLLTPLYAILQGCGQVTNFTRLKMCQSIVTSLVSWALLTKGAKLYAAPAFNTVSLLMGVAWIWHYRACLTDLLTVNPKNNTINWKSEIWPFQWQIALSGVASYFIFLFSNPVLFAVRGPVAAGQMGISSAILGAFALGGGAWLNTKSAPFGVLIARREWKALDDLFFPALWQSLQIVAAGGLLIWLATFYLYSSGHPWGQRFLSPWPMGLFVATTIVNHVVGAQAIYLRAHKQDPFLPISLALGILTGLSTYLLGKAFGATGMMGGYFILSLTLGLGVGSWIFKEKRQQWHEEPIKSVSDILPVVEVAP